MRIENSVVLVTGANRGLGKVFAERVVAAGARKVYGGARDPRKLELAGVEPIKLNITDPADVRAAAKACGDVTILFNNAGIAPIGSLIGDSALDVARNVMETNFFGTLQMCEAFAPVLGRNGGGALVNMLSALSWITWSSIPAYCASKSAEWALTNAIRQELKAQNTLVIGVHAGLIDTDMAAAVDAPKARPEDIVERIIEGIIADLPEVLADDTSRQVKAGFAKEPPAYLA